MLTPLSTHINTRRPSFSRVIAIETGTHVPSLEDISFDVPPFSNGSCAQADPELFFPRKGDSVAPARRICASCPVLSECFAWNERTETGDSAYSVQGFIAGETAAERIRRRKQDGRGLPVEPPAVEYGRCHTCGRGLRPRGVAAGDCPGTVCAFSKTECDGCYRRRYYPASGIGERYGTCATCGRAIRPKRLSPDAMPGTIAAANKTTFQTCAAHQLQTRKAA